MTFACIVLTLSVLFSLVLPIAVLGIRETVKKQRQKILRDLGGVFSPKDKIAEMDDDLIPSFEFVKHKYFLPSSIEGGTMEIAANEKPLAPRETPGWSWLIALIPFTATLLVLSLMTFSILLAKAIPDLASGSWTEPFSSLIGGGDHNWLWALIASFAGGYVLTTRSLFQAINNFDLSPASFVDATVNILTGVTTAIVLTIIGPPLLLSISPGTTTPTDAIALPGLHPIGGVLVLSTVVGIAFMVGHIPDLGLRTIKRSVGLRSFKREDESIYEAFRATPVEIIDGIDSQIRSRLTDYHIVSVQNLATANPIMLFVETPYGVYQIMDWVAQAQLCASVGSRAVVELWKLGVRTIFDLERIALDPAYRDASLLKAVGRAMLCEAVQLNDPTEATIIANIRMRLDAPHVHRLRQIFIQISARLGLKNRRLPIYLSDCPGLGDNDCPYQHALFPRPSMPHPGGAIKAQQTA